MTKEHDTLRSGKRKHTPKREKTTDERGHTFEENYRRRYYHTSRPGYARCIGGSGMPMVGGGSELSGIACAIGPILPGGMNESCGCMPFGCPGR
eukprot:scaffold88319_cov61-Phaeocystis_antarctica.AAC.3